MVDVDKWFIWNLLSFPSLMGHDKDKLLLNGEALKFYEDAFVTIRNLPPMKILYEKKIYVDLWNLTNIDM